MYRRSYGAVLWCDEPDVGRRVAAGARVKTAGAAERTCVNNTKHPVLLMDRHVLALSSGF